VKRLPLGFYRPVGTTDSEHAFCWMLEQLRRRWDRPPPVKTLAAEIRRLAQELNRLGVFNMLLSEGRALFCFCSTELAWLTRRAPFGPATLIDEDLTVDFSRETTPDDVVTVIATRPLTVGEPWRVMERGTFVAFRDGEPSG